MKANSLSNLYFYQKLNFFLFLRILAKHKYYFTSATSVTSEKQFELKEKWKKNKYLNRKNKGIN